MVKKTDVIPEKFSLKEYALTLAQIKKEVQEAQSKAIISANRKLIKLYWLIGKIITEKQAEYGWGSKILEKLASDLQNEFPGIAGFSRANIFHMRSFYAAYEIVQKPSRQLEDLPIFSIPWWHNILLMTKIKNAAERLWYAQKTVDNGWSKSLLEAAIKSNLYKREGKAISNFHATLPDPQSIMVQQSFKDPYVFDFLALQADHLEHDLEQGLIDNVQKLLLEMGKGFAMSIIISICFFIT